MCKATVLKLSVLVAILLLLPRRSSKLDGLTPSNPLDKQEFSDE